jgi:SAM-dependent methyltransferase
MTVSAAYDTKSASYFGNARREIEPLLPDAIDTVLEIGCGAGATLEWIRETRGARHTTGVELTGPAAELARRRVDRVICGDVENMALDIAPASLDLILALDVLEHLRDPWAAVRKLHPLLKPGGAMISSIPNVGHYSVALPLLVKGRWDYVDEGLLDRTHLRFFVERTALELASCSGLRVDRVIYKTKLPAFVDGWPRSLLGRHVRWQFPKLAPHLFRFQFLIRAVAAGSAQPAEHRPERTDAPILV